jgi:hypothetical protein
VWVMTVHSPVWSQQSPASSPMRGIHRRHAWHAMIRGILYHSSFLIPWRGEAQHLQLQHMLLHRQLEQTARLEGKVTRQTLTLTLTLTLIGGGR